MSNIVEIEGIWRVKLLHKDYITWSAFEELAGILMEYFEVKTQEELWNRFEPSEIMTTHEDTEEEIMYAIGTDGMINYEHVIHTPADIDRAADEVIAFIEDLEDVEDFEDFEDFEDVV
jgi:hypothetical protein